MRSSPYLQSVYGDPTDYQCCLDGKRIYYYNYTTPSTKLPIHESLDHTFLVERLRSYFRFSGTALQWFSSYLHGRSQRVIISQARYLEVGVPQGSILGPLLSTLYIGPLQDVIQAYNLNYMFYADKSQVYIAINPNNPSNPLTTLPQCVEHIFSWNTRNMLKAILERPRCCILHRVLWSNHSLVTASHLQGLKLTSQRKQGIEVLLWIIICHLVVTSMKFVIHLLSP